MTQTELNQRKICKNCWFWQEKKLDPGYRIPEQWPGRCMAAPTPVNRLEEDVACLNFDSKFPKVTMVNGNAGTEVLENLNVVM